MAEIWYSEDLFLSSDKENSSLERSNSSEENTKSVGSTNGIIRVHRPQWQFALKKELKTTNSGILKYLILKFGFEFALNKGTSNSIFTFARCETYIRSTSTSEITQPIVYDIFPKDLYEMEQSNISLKLGPEIKIGDIGGSLGELSMDLITGYLSPSVVGWKGDNERSPYWELRPVKKPLIGIQNLWAVLECPPECKEVRVSTRAQAVLQSHIGRIPVGPKELAWENRPSISIQIQ